MTINQVFALALLAFIGWRISQMVLGKTSPARARELVGQGALLLDVRTPGEFGAGHLEGALNVPLQVLAGRTNELAPRDRPVVLYCASGMRSASAARLLRRDGFAHVFDLGAMSRWGA